MIYLRGDVRKETDDLKTISKYGKGGWQVSNVKGVRGGGFLINTKPRNLQFNKAAIQNE